MPSNNRRKNAIQTVIKIVDWQFDLTTKRAFAIWSETDFLTIIFAYNVAARDLFCVTFSEELSKIRLIVVHDIEITFGIIVRAQFFNNKTHLQTNLLVNTFFCNI